MAMPFQPWRASLVPASFRGAPFYVQAGGFGTGRRNVTHQFPKNDTPFTEDMGRRARHWPITGYVIGPFYQGDRDALIAACEAGGPGTLVHPTLGEMLVNCDGCNPTETSERGGICVLEMAFVEAGALPNTGVTSDTQSAAQSSASNLGNASSSSVDTSVASSNGAGPGPGGGSGFGNNGGTDYRGSIGG